MPKQSISILIEAAVLKWARVSIAEDLEEAARRIKVKVQLLEDWEEGRVKPELRLTQLEELSRFYRRPIATFLLPESPKEPSLPKDFRTLYGEEGQSLPRKVRLAIRDARWFQSMAAELAGELGREIKLRIGEATRGANIDELALRERKRFGITANQQFQWKDKTEALKRWKSAVEGLGVLVFQFSLSSDQEDMRIRGFSLADELPFVVVLNSKDNEHPKIFSLFHEYAHLMLHVSGVCDMDWTNPMSIEIFCNRFAGAFLVPRDDLLVHHLIKNHGKSYEWSGEELRELSQEFKVSREVILRRLLTLKLTTDDFYKQWRSKRKKPKKKTKGDEKSGPPPERVSVAQHGLTLTSYILDAYRREIITSLDAADYLRVRVGRISEVRAEVGELVS